MPRISSESRSAAEWRAAGTMVEPPPWLNAEAQTLWRQIVASRPADYFDGGSRPLLELFVGLAVHARFISRKLAKAKPESAQAADLERRAALLSKCMCSLAGKLRLTVTAKFRPDHGRNTERGLGDAADDPLIGGNAVWGRKQ